MIVTLTLNPAIDRTIRVERIHPTDVTRVQKTLRQPAGKGINVSRVLHKLGQKTLACALLGGDNGDFIASELKRMGVPFLSQNIAGDTRENIKIVPAEGRIIELNEPGPKVDESVVHHLMDRILETARAGDILVFTGSLPPGLSNTLYGDLITRAKQAGLITVLDASAERFAQGIDAGPTIVKPNRYELEEYLGREIHATAWQEATDALLAKGVQEVLVTLGSHGAYYRDASGAFRVAPLLIDAINPVGAGDSFLAGYLAAKADGLAPRKRLAFATAVATSSVLYEGTGPKDMTHIQQLLTQVRVTEA